MNNKMKIKTILFVSTMVTGSVTSFSTMASQVLTSNETVQVSIKSKDFKQTHTFGTSDNPNVITTSSVNLSAGERILGVSSSFTREEYFDYTKYEPWYCFGDVICDADDTIKTTSQTENGLTFIVVMSEESNRVVVKGEYSELISIDGHWKLFEGEVLKTPIRNVTEIDMTFDGVSEKTECQTFQDIEVCLKSSQTHA